MDEEKTAEKQRQADEEAKEAGKEGGADPVRWSAHENPLLFLET